MMDGLSDSNNKSLLLFDTYTNYATIVIHNFTFMSVVYRVLLRNYSVPDHKPLSQSVSILVSISLFSLVSTQQGREARGRINIVFRWQGR